MGLRTEIRDVALKRSVIAVISKKFDSMRAGDIVRTSRYEIEHNGVQTKGVCHLLVTRLEDGLRLLVVVDEGFGFGGRTYSIRELKDASGAGDEKSGMSLNTS